MTLYLYTVKQALNIANNSQMIQKLCFLKKYIDKRNPEVRTFPRKKIASASFYSQNRMDAADVQIDKESLKSILRTIFSPMTRGHCAPLLKKKHQMRRPKKRNLCTKKSGVKNYAI